MISFLSHLVQRTCYFRTVLLLIKFFSFKNIRSAQFEAVVVGVVWQSIVAAIEKAPYQEKATATRRIGRSKKRLTIEVWIAVHEPPSASARRSEQFRKCLVRSHIVRREWVSGRAIGKCLRGCRPIKAFLVRFSVGSAASDCKGMYLAARKDVHIKFSDFYKNRWQ